MGNRGLIHKITQIIFAGALVGVLLCLFLSLASIIVSWSNDVVGDDLLDFVRCLFFFSLCLVPLMAINNHFGKKWSDNGMSLIEKYYDDGKEWNPFHHIFFVFINSLASFFSGFLLGSEAPSVAMASSCGRISNIVFKDEDEDIVKGAGSAAFASCYLSPIAGLFHLIEENKKHLKTRTILIGMPIIALSYLVVFLFKTYVYPLHILHLEFLDPLPLKIYPLLLLVGFSSVVVAKLFFIAYRLIERSRFMMKFMDILTFLLAVLYMFLKRYCPILVGIGVDITVNTYHDYAWYLLLGILIFRVINTSLSYKSSLSGGVVIPVMALGAILSDMLVSIFLFKYPHIEQYSTLLRFVGMITVFASVSGNFLTAYSLIFNTTIAISALPSFVALALAKGFDVLFNLFIGKAEQSIERNVKRGVI